MRGYQYNIKLGVPLKDGCRMSDHTCLKYLLDSGLFFSFLQADISARLSSQDRKMTTLEDRILNSQTSVTCAKPVSVLLCFS